VDGSCWRGPKETLVPDVHLCIWSQNKMTKAYICLLFLCFFVCSAGNQIQGLEHARQVSTTELTPALCLLLQLFMLTSFFKRLTKKPTLLMSKQGLLQSYVFSM
jgi:hypothetical protein